MDNETLLDDNALIFLKGTHGVVGLLDKWLWLAKQYSIFQNKPIDIDILRLSAPPISEQFAIAEDIKKGQEALKSGCFTVVTDNPTTESTSPDGHKEIQVRKGRSKGKPFRRKPKRINMNGFQVADCA